MTQTTEICPHCMGSGESGPDQKCWTCNGSGGVPQTTKDILDRLRPWSEYDPQDLDCSGPNEGLIKDAMSEIEDLRTSVIAFGAPWAVKYAEEWGLPPKHLDPRHYDILKRAGARMDDFIRGSAENG